MNGRPGGTVSGVTVGHIDEWMVRRMGQWAGIWTARWTSGLDDWRAGHGGYAVGLIHVKCLLDAVAIQRRPVNQPRDQRCATTC